jgi:hypothetical protein
MSDQVARDHAHGSDEWAIDSEMPLKRLLRSVTDDAATITEMVAGYRAFAERSKAPSFDAFMQEHFRASTALLGAIEAVAAIQRAWVH